MEENQNTVPASNPEQFGMTQEEYRQSKIKSILLSIKLFLQKAEPVFVKVFNVTLYYLIKFIRSFLSSAFQMIKGGG